MSEGPSNSTAPVVQLDANSLRALSDTLAPLILERVQRSLPASRATAREAPPAASHQMEDDSVALFADHDDLADNESASEEASTPGSISEATTDLITATYVSTPLANSARREILSTHPLPSLDCLKPPKLDASMARLVRGDVVARDRVLSKPGDWFTKVDLKDAYFHVPIHQTHQKFLSFRWEERVFQFVCLPFGLASAPRTFTKVMKPALACLRQLGVRCIVYLDDLLIMGQSPEEARQVTANTLALFQALGFLINWEKSILEPKQEIVFLGLLVSSRTMTLSLPSPKLIDLHREIQSLLTKEVVSVRQLAHIVGKLNSTALAVLPAPLHYRELQNLKISSLHEMESYNAQTALSPAARDDLSWWLGQLQRWNGRSFIVKRPEVVIQSDASLRGWGAVYQGQCIQGRWSFEESTWHINCLELKAATLAIQTFLNGQRNLQVHIQLDNTSAVAYINHKGGTHSPQLMKLTSNLWEWCLDRQIQVLATHLPGVCNIQADHLSRHLTDRCDWKLNPIVFQSILHIWGPLEMDWFASRLSTQLPLFCSWKPDPEAWATDAFGQDWTQFRGFANPPWCLVGRCLQQVEHQEAELVMVTPAWFSQPWWPQILSLCVELPHLIPSRPDIMVPTSPAMPPLFENPPQLVVWKLSGNLAKQTSFQSRLRDCSSPHGESLQARATTQHGGNGLAGVTKGKFLQFLVLPIR